MSAHLQSVSGIPAQNCVLEKRRVLSREFRGQLVPFLLWERVLARRGQFFFENKQKGEFQRIEKL